MNSTEHNPSLYADSSSAGQQNFSPITETECSLPCTQQPASGPYLNPDEHSSQSFSLHFNNQFNIYTAQRDTQCSCTD